MTWTKPRRLSVGVSAHRPLLLEQYCDDKDEISGAFALMQPMPGAIGAVHVLAPLEQTLEYCAAWLGDALEGTGITHDPSPRRVAQLGPANRDRLRAKHANALGLQGQPWPDHERVGLGCWSEFENPELYRDWSNDSV